jgi:predicted kinase
VEERTAISAVSERADARLEAGRLEPRHVRALATWLALRHERAGPAPSPAGAAAADLDRAVAALARALPELAGEDLREVERTQRRFLAERGDRLRERAGRIREAPGAPLRLRDLRVADSGAVETAARHRGGAPLPPRDACVDAVSLALDLAIARRGDLAERLLSAYAGEADDFELYGVVDYHERACALDRAAALAEGAPASGPERDALLAELRRLLLVARATRRPPLRPPVVVAVGGLVASGKSTVSRELAESLGAPRVHADRVRDQLLGDRPGCVVHESRWTRSLAPGFGERVYRELLRRAAIVLDSGRSIVLDACFPQARQRATARRLARRAGRPFLFVECRTDPATQAARLAARDAQAERPGWIEIHRELAEQWEPVRELGAVELLILDTGRPLAESLARVEARLAGFWPASPAASDERPE